MSLAVLDKVKIRHSFAVAAASYDSAAMLQRQVGLALLQKFPLQPTPGWVLDVGCGTGFLTRRLSVGSLELPCLALDIALPMLQASRRNNGDLPVDYFCADAEKLPFADNSLQQVYSNLALQWCQDLPAVFADVRRLLSPDGQLVFSTFGPETLKELKTAWSGVDDFAHVNDFYSVGQIRDFLRVVGLERVDVETVMYRLAYPSVLALMRELKDLGAHNVSLGRNRRLTTRSQLQQMILHYENSMLNSEILASYEIIFVRASL
ncbi:MULTISPECIES: malonyl-ACP O-methyltransferase BioC [Methylomonas]|uniref:Malonyl-[acyl-carrier protein] O-methyltransferase n=2 Tax=Methylomonas TaxID=416 RepID=A0A140E3I3_9GAMM|nr:MULTISPECIES: malonyl-ACP O-methyltransferase BioC [Methylomonas]AMK74957.1 malonyl-[acyl-carrier protein] O-methyltransferase BioC [Methylomonas denitrificans]OAI05818.1 malonyl-[acyl-carrier protein] O-methyltransferase BioC [Methylomonas methanica]TCV80972.1 malonyl-CoA O-methyltransferase [Methylomonas methanica]